MAEADTTELTRLLTDFDAVAIVSRQKLRPAEGVGMPFHPPTYLGPNDEPTYCVSPLADGRNLCVVDSVQSQANRIEAMFLREPYRGLVRRVTVTAKLRNAETRTLDMLELGHRLADAAVSFSSLSGEAHDAFRAFDHSPEAIARLSPMSLLMGVWESRGVDSQLKIPRAFGATITARDVQALRRFATYTGSFWSKDLGLEGKRSEEGLDPVPAGEALGGVVAAGEIVRVATLNLVALRQNCAVEPNGSPAAVASYVYGLGLVAMSAQPETFLRQGCLLVADGESSTVVVTRRGTETPLSVSRDDALHFATYASRSFGVLELAPIEATFEVDRVSASKAAKEKPAKAKATRSK
jgi:CRISPR-associated protein Csb1